jgi:hypothetical protein
MGSMRSMSKESRIASLASMPSRSGRKVARRGSSSIRKLGLPVSNQ